MLTEERQMDIFHAARHYEFDRIKEYIMQGGEVKVCDECGLSLLTCFVQGYFEFGEACFLAEETEEDGRLFGREKLTPMLLKERK